MRDEIPNIHNEMRTLYHTSRVVRTAHFLAARVLKRLDQKRQTEGEPSSQLSPSQTASSTVESSTMT